MTTLQVILGEQTNFSYMLCKAKCLYSHGTPPALNIYRNVAIKRRPQVNTEKKLFPNISAPKKKQEQ